MPFNEAEDEKFESQRCYEFLFYSQSAKTTALEKLDITKATSINWLGNLLLHQLANKLLSLLEKVIANEH